MVDWGIGWYLSHITMESFWYIMQKLNDMIWISLGNDHYLILSASLVCFLVSWSDSAFHLTAWTLAQQTSLSFTISQGLLKLISNESVIPSNHLILCCPFSYCPQSFIASGSFPSRLFTSGGQSIGALASASDLPMNIQGWFPLGLTGLISLLSKGLSRVFSRTTVWKSQFFST